MSSLSSPTSGRRLRRFLTAGYGPVMNFHDNRGMFDEIAKWLEKHYVEIDWDAVKQCKWWIGPADWEPPPKWSLPKPCPSPLSTQLCTKLLLAQWWHGLTIRPELVNPLDDPENELLGGEGVDLPPGGVAAT